VTRARLEDQPLRLDIGEPAACHITRPMAGVVRGCRLCCARRRQPPPSRMIIRRWRRANSTLMGQKRSYFDQLAWAGPATLNGLLVTTAPIRRTDTRLPTGVPIIDGFLDDRTTIAFAGMVEREFGGFTPPRCCNRPTRRRPGTTVAAAGVDWTGARCSAADERWTYCVSSAPVIKRLRLGRGSPPLPDLPIT
jgi:hypothetical protein